MGKTVVFLYQSAAMMSIHAPYSASSAFHSMRNPEPGS